MTARAVLEQLAVEVGERLVADGADRARRELEPALALLDEARLLEHLRELAQPVERRGGVVAEQLAGAVEVDLGELAGLGGRAHEVLEVVEVAERVRAGPASRRTDSGSSPRKFCDRSHGRFGNACCRLRDELVDLPAQVHVLEQRLGQRLQLGALLGRHRVEELLHLRHRLRHLLEQLVEALRVAGEELAVALHEALEVGLLAALALLEHLVELVQHVLHLLHALGGHVLHALGHLVEVALHQLFLQLLHELFELLARRVVHELVVLQRLHLAREVGRHHVELHATALRRALGDLLALLVTRGGGLVDAPVDALALHVDDLVELHRDVVVHAAEVAVLELLATALAEALHHLAQPHELVAVPVAEALLHHPAQRRVEVAVVEEVVAHLVEERLGVEVEALLACRPSASTGTRSPDRAGTTSSDASRLPTPGSLTDAAARAPRRRPSPARASGACRPRSPCPGASPATFQ